jgi:uncharacterized membrane protein YeaQ/YmgE (transglycosylase-associated protein family)
LQTNSWSIRNLPAGTYYWSVQAIDNSYEGSTFAAEKFFSVAYSNSIAPVADQNLTLNQQGNALTITESSAPVSRQWKYSTVSGGPYNQVITGATGQSWIPSFTGAGTYYVVCVSTKDAYSYISNEVRINVMTFTEQSQINLNQVGVGTTSWCDFDNDGDLDLLVAGATSNSMATGLYRNDAGTFTIVNAGLPATLYCSSSWGDYDYDGYADLLMTGYIGTNSYFTRIYRNNAGVFSDINAGLPGVYQGSAVWGDFDNDGDQDIALCGATSSTTQISRIYENRNGTFTEINAGIEGLRQSFVSWADYDNDGDLDLLLSGNSTTTISKLYRNDNGTFTDVNAGFTGVRLGSGAWGDYDNDGDADLLLSGYLNDNGSNVYIAKIYRNDAGIFTDIVAGLRGTYFGTASWSDYDNDGDLDILLSGNSGILETTVYRNDNGIFTGSGIGLKQLEGSSASWGDYDNDGDLDFVLSGSSSDGYYTKVYKNHTLTANTPANAPTGLQSTAVSAGRVRLSWNKGTDTQTPQNDLNYNLRIGTSTGAINKAAPASSPSGYRRIPAIGNAGLTSGSYFISLPLGKYYWSVQAIDQAFAGGAWSAESTFTVLAAPVAIPATGIQSYSFNAKWNSSAGATGYRVDVATDAAFTSMVTGYNNTDAGNATSLQVSGLNPNTTYYYRVRAYCSDGTSAGSNVVNLMTLIVPPAAPSGLTIKSCSDLITLTWTANTEANFSKYVIFGGSSTNPNTRMDSISSISTVTKTISGLVHGQTYYFRVKAVNTGGAESQFSTQVSSVVSKGHIPVIKTKFKNDLIVCYNPGDSISQWQWYKETTAISGQTKQYYKAGKNPGEYYVVTTDKNGCVNTSNKIKLTGAAAMVIWPNPASSNFTVKLNSDATGEAVISLYNSSGRKILEKRTEKNNTELLYQMIGGQLMKGIYTLEIIVNEDEVSRTPVVIAK